MSKKVLIADDEPNILISLEFLMQREGHAVSVARDGEEALLAIRRERPDLVLLDVMMPGKSGFDVCQAVRGDPDLAGIKILMPDSVSIERRQMLEVFGAELILTPGPEGSNGAVRRAQAMAAEHPEYCFLYQYANDANPQFFHRTLAIDCGA